MSTLKSQISTRGKQTNEPTLLIEVSQFVPTKMSHYNFLVNCYIAYIAYGNKSPKNNPVKPVINQYNLWKIKVHQW